jgi:sortase (surface protein transpeptidase)
MVTPLLGFNNSNIPPSISFLGTKTIPVFPWYSKVVRRNNDSIPNLVSDILGKNIIQGNEVTLATNDIEKTIQDQIKNNKNLPLDKLIPRPANPKYTKLLIYPEYGVNAPIGFTELKDLYETNEDGTFKKNDKGQLIEIVETADAIKNRNYLSTPVQRLLVEGVVHLYYPGVAPGEVGNSYIVGHTSNYASVQSAYNAVFKPLERQSKVGQEFIIFDKYGRELTFRVFEVLEIGEDDGEIAYKTFGEKRVVTLQGSILEYGYNKQKEYNLWPLKRWLTRGELVLR